VLKFNGMKTALVTGASSGIGQALSVALGKEGYLVGLVARRKDKLKQTKKMVEEAGGKAEIFSCDLGDDVQTDSLVDRVKQWTHNLDLLANVAGVQVYKPISEVKTGDWDLAFDINVTATFKLIRGLLPILKSDKSLVLSVGSGMGVIPARGRSVYCASKFALRGLILSLAEEFEGGHPHFSLITLGSTLTGFGDETVEERKKEFEKGAAYFPVEWVVGRLLEVIESNHPEAEYVWYPGEHGFGVWKKP